ncbi:MAG: YIP1 family protein [Treponema sp.]|jgi:hypothetical protein|nr:YIP1 family protein [Treponema sp.]
MRRLLESLGYIPYLLFHPFDGFYEAKFRGKDSAAAATVLLLLYGAARIIAAQYSGFVVNYNSTYEVESGQVFLASVMPLMLFLVSDYCAAMLLNGNGSFKDIYLVICYSLVPMIFFDIIFTLASNLIILEESPLLGAFHWIGIIWFLFLLFAGLCVVHEYSALQNLGSLLGAAAAAVIIIFVSVLLLTLADKVLSFFRVISIEVMSRWWRQ